MDRSGDQITFKNPDSPRRLTDVLIIILTLAGIGWIYFSIPNYLFFSDGLQYAIDIRYSTTPILHPHHLMYPLLPQIFSWVNSSGSGRELDLLADWSNVMGLLSAVFFTLILMKHGLNTTVIIAGLVLFAFSNGVWFFSVTPNQNSTAMLLHLICLYYLSLPAVSRDLKISYFHLTSSAGLISLATLGSQVNIFLLIPAAWLIVSRPDPIKNKLRSVVLLTILTLSMTIAGYLLIGYFLGGMRSISDFFTWQKSYVFQSRWWSGSLIDAIHRNFNGLLDVLIGNSNVLPKQGSSAPMDFLLLFSKIYIAAFLLIEFLSAVVGFIREKRWNSVLSFFFLAGLPFLIFSIFYIPENMNLRILYLPGFTAMLSLYWNKKNSKTATMGAKSWLAIAASILLIITNLGGKFIPESVASSNPWLVDVGELISSEVTPDDLIIYPWTDEGHVQSLYAQYYIGCDAMTVNKLMDLEKSMQQDQFVDFLYGSSGSRKFLIESEVINLDEGGSSLSEKYGEAYSQDLVIDFMQKYFVLTDPPVEAGGGVYYTVFLTSRSG